MKKTKTAVGRNNKEPGFAYIIMVLLIGVFLGLNIQLFEKNVSFPLTTTTLGSVRAGGPTVESMNSTILVAAVDDQGNGVVSELIVETKSGTGKVLTNIDKLVFWYDTQNSIQIARDVAEQVTGISADALDIVYTVKAGEATLVGGPSAGAALAVATVSVLQNKPLNKSVIITGTINPDGTIGTVGGIVEKAMAARDAGAKLFVVPAGEGTQTYVKPEEKCTERPGFVYCQTVYRETTVNIGRDLGIDVAEASTIEEAIKYFFD